MDGISEFAVDNHMLTSRPIDLFNVITHSYIVTCTIVVYNMKNVSNSVFSCFKQTNFGVLRTE